MCAEVAMVRFKIVSRVPWKNRNAAAPANLVGGVLILYVFPGEARGAQKIFGIQSSTPIPNDDTTSAIAVRLWW